jgi:hypothetical protein
MDVKLLEQAEHDYVWEDGGCHVWKGEAHGVTVVHYTTDDTAVYWVSPIWTMREKGVALVDLTGQMVKQERKDR